MKAESAILSGGEHFPKMDGKAAGPSAKQIPGLFFLRIPAGPIERAPYRLPLADESKERSGHHEYQTI